MTDEVERLLLEIENQTHVINDLRAMNAKLTKDHDEFLAIRTELERQLKAEKDGNWARLYDCNRLRDAVDEFVERVKEIS